ncbi:MAG: 4a-hydroxytetrahydrobiopterin dehydratase [Nannocystaceae bacterium]
MSTPLPESYVQARLANLSGWSTAEGKLHREYRFPNFVTAFAFMTKVAAEAETLGHHPNWSNVYGEVDVTLWTHDVGGLTELDLKLAAAMERCAKETS